MTTSLLTRTIKTSPTPRPAAAALEPVRPNDNQHHLALAHRVLVPLPEVKAGVEAVDVPDFGVMGRIPLQEPKSATSGNMVQVLEGIDPGDRVIGKGSLFIDRVAAGT